MPYASDRQRRFMHAQHPRIAKRIDREVKKKGLPIVKQGHTTSKKTKGGK